MINRIVVQPVVFFLFSSAALAECTEYEKQVFDLIDRAEEFQESDAFQRKGWTLNNWMQDFNQVRDSASNEQALSFLQKHDFAIADVYMVADEFRTSGHLEGFFSDLHETITNAERCH